jgi:DNA primase
MQDAKEEIRQRLAVEDVVGQYIELKRAGRSLKGLSPWTNERTPSFMVSPEKGIWHDFSSNRGGDIFTFVMEVEGISFREALEKLARQAGVDLVKYGNDDSALTKRKLRIRECLELASKYFQVALVKNKAVCEYVFYKRNLNRGTVGDFGIGYAPSSGRAVRDFLEKKGFSEREMRDAGMLNQYGGDLFKGRMIVPLLDTTGSVVGFTGRILDDKDKNAPKYLNTPETLLYNKGRHIFGLAQAKEAIRKSGFAVLVEGNMDVISSHQAGVKEAVATAGTAMTEMHLKAMSRLTNDIRLAYDGDDAGVSAAERAISIAGKIDVNLSVISDYGGAKDPDELIQKGANLWKEAVEGKVPAVDWLLAKYEEKLDIRTGQGKREYSNVAVKLISGLGDPVERKHYEQVVAEKLEVSVEDLRAKKVESGVRKLKQVKSATVSMEEASVAEKNLAALAEYGGVDVDKELIYSKLDNNELSLIYEHRYESFGEDAKKKEAAELTRRIKEEKLKKQKKRLQEQLVVAEEKGDETEEKRLVAEINKINKMDTAI